MTLGMCDRHTLAGFRFERVMDVNQDAQFLRFFLRKPRMEPFQIRFKFRDVTRN